MWTSAPPRRACLVVLEKVGARFAIQSKGRPQPSTQDAAQPLSLIPGGSRRAGRATACASCATSFFSLAALARMVEGEIDLTEAFAPRPSFFEPSILRLAQLFAEECRTAGSMVT